MLGLIGPAADDAQRQGRRGSSKQKGPVAAALGFQTRFLKDRLGGFSHLCQGDRSRAAVTCRRSFSRHANEAEKGLRENSAAAGGKDRRKHASLRLEGRLFLNAARPEGGQLPIERQPIQMGWPVEEEQYEGRKERKHRSSPL